MVVVVVRLVNLRVGVQMVNRRRPMNSRSAAAAGNAVQFGVDGANVVGRLIHPTAATRHVRIQAVIRVLLMTVGSVRVARHFTPQFHPPSGAVGRRVRLPPAGFRPVVVHHHHHLAG